MSQLQQMTILHRSAPQHIIRQELPAAMLKKRKGMGRKPQWVETILIVSRLCCVVSGKESGLGGTLCPWGKSTVKTEAWFMITQGGGLTGNGTLDDGLNDCEPN
jgi:hypothetical protein